MLFDLRTVGRFFSLIALLSTAIPAHADIPHDACGRLYAAILVHDNIYPGVVPPAKINFAFKKNELNDFYALSEKLWEEGFDRKRLRSTIEKLSEGGDLSPEDAEYYRSVRAKFKQLRFAFAAFGEEHKYPKNFDKLTATMGHFQDALKNFNQTITQEKKAEVMKLLSKENVEKIRAELNQFKPSGQGAFTRYVSEEVHELKALASRPKVTSKQFHEMRKVISRQVAIFDTIQTMHPSEEHLRTVQFLSTLNGKMGAIHDQLIAKSFTHDLDYRRDLIDIPEDIRQGLLQLVEHY